jgi:hypothetical protein
LRAAHVNPLPEISQVVEVILIAVADPYWAKLLDPVVPAELRYMVSVVIAIVTTWDVMLINVIAVPMGYATELLAGMVKVLAFASVDGWRMCLPASASTSV